MVLFHVTLNLLARIAAEMGGPYTMFLFLQLRELHQLVGFTLQWINKLIWLTLWPSLDPTQGRRQEHAAKRIEEQSGPLPSLGC